ncbi:MAG: hypothetical protein EBS19_13895, partial [Spirochaetia bacterium]|nr:hypothetical protein [Spirochaetia bacterium]
DYTPAVITLATLASKEAAFFGGNILAHSTARCLAYSGIQDWFEDVTPQKIKNIFACAKIYDTRSGTDPLFPESLLEDPILLIP